MIVFLSDHGEGLGDHGEEEHGVFLYREAIQVPLIVKLPGSRAAGETVMTPVQIVDLFPTIAGQIDAGVDLSRYPGSSLIDLIGAPTDESRQVYAETYYPKFHFGWSDLHSLVDGRYHYIRAPKPELYDLAADFEETENVLDENRRVYFAMNETTELLVHEPSAPAPVDPEEAAKLAALGYLGSTVETSPDETLPDPKDRIGVLREMKAASASFGRDQFEEALRKVDAILANNERMLDMWELRAKILEALGRHDDAIASAKKGLEIAPTARHLMLMIARLELELGNLEEAETHAELAAGLQPGPANEILASIAVERGDLGEAETFIRKAAEADPDDVTVLMTRARIAGARGNPQQALQIFGQALSLLNESDRDEVPDIHLLRGDILARMGRAREAEREFRRQIELYPEEPQAYRKLVVLLVTQNRLDDATNVLTQLIETAPTPRSYLAVCRTLEILGDERGARYWARQGLEKFPDVTELRRYL